MTCSQAAAARPGRVAVDALGERRYWGLLRIADAMLGNSSSALIEAPAVDLPAVDVGDRQAGRRARPQRPRTPRADPRAVADALREALDPATAEPGRRDPPGAGGWSGRGRASRISSPHGDHPDRRASPRSRCRADRGAAHRARRRRARAGGHRCRPLAGRLAGSCRDTSPRRRATARPRDVPWLGDDATLAARSRTSPRTTGRGSSSASVAARPAAPRGACRDDGAVRRREVGDRRPRRGLDLAECHAGTGRRGPRACRREHRCAASVATPS